MRTCERCGKPHQLSEACLLEVVGVKIDMAPGKNCGNIVRDHVDLSAPGDYGCDPLGDGTFRMVPSGDVVDYAERCRRLSRK